MSNQTKKATKFKEILPHGSIKELAELSGASTITVGRVIRGESKNKAVNNALKVYIKELAATKEQIESGLESLAN